MDPKTIYMLVIFGLGYIVAFMLFKITSKNPNKSKE